jgi:predicted nucleic acid-binding protein
MIVVDTSAWVEFLRRSGSAVNERLRSALRAAEELAVTEVVIAEVLSGARTEQELESWRRLVLGFRVLRLRGLVDYEAAAALQRACRAAGEPVRGLPDCLVAVPAILAGAEVLHADRDFETLARHTRLRTVNV